MTKKELQRRFPRESPIGQEFSTMAGYLDAMVPDCREKALAMTKLEEAMFWILAIAQRPPEDHSEP